MTSTVYGLSKKFSFNDRLECDSGSSHCIRYHNDSAGQRIPCSTLLLGSGNKRIV